MSDEYLYHHGILGQRWGKKNGPPYPLSTSDHSSSEKKAGWQKSLDKQRNKIESLYSHANKWVNRKISKLEKKNKPAKVAVAKEMLKYNEKARKEKLANLESIKSEKQYKQMRHLDNMDILLLGKRYMKENSGFMLTPFSRLSEYHIQRGARFINNVTFEKTLARMTPKEGYDYLRRKATIIRSGAYR